jgi:3-dehydroquinate synthase
MNNFKIDNTSLAFPDTLRLSGLKYEISSTPRNYELTGFNDLANIRMLIKNGLSDNGCLIIDKNVYEIYFKNNINSDQDRIFIVDAEESNKNMQTVLNLCDFYIKHNINKGSKVYVVGGGILQDLGGSASYLYKRGVPWIYIPTTLLGISDSCLGGKTAINYKKYKNLLGFFSAPSEVILSIEFIESLSEQDIACGYGEIFRLALTGGNASFEIFKSNILDSLNGDKEAMKLLIITSLLVKKAVIEKDEYEVNIRKSMNYGHTIGHAIEALTNFKIPHGIGVAIGILVENNISKELNFMKKSLCDEIIQEAKKIIHKKYLKLLSSNACKNIAEYLRKDKKTIGNKANYTYLSELGNMEFAYHDIDKTNDLVIKSIDLVIRELVIE